MIVRDEEEYLAQCLESMKDIVDEVIIVDTGSGDKTLEIAKRFGAKVIHFKWNYDTGAARNISLKNATKDWILVLDADEFITEKEEKLIKKIIAENIYDAVRMIQHNYVNDVNHGGFRNLEHNDLNYGKYIGYFPTPIIRLFRNTKGIFFEGKMHEIVDKSVEGRKVFDSNIHFYHYGFVRTKQRKQRKDKHYAELAEVEDEQDPRVPYLKGVAYSKDNKIKKAITYFERAIKLMPNNIQLGYVLGAAYLQDNNTDSAISIMEKGIKIRKEEAETFDNQDCYVDLYANLGAAYLKKGLAEKALSVLENGLEYGKNPKIYNNLSAVCMSLKQPKKALLYISSALKIAPNDIALLSNFASILVQVSRNDHAIMVYKRLSELDNKDKWEKRIKELK